MKNFNLFIIATLILMAGGFIFFRDGFLKTQSSQSSTATTPILMDRLNYLDYSEQNLVSAQRNGKTVLFFAATIWCQTCSELDKEIKERLVGIPSDVTILKVDYDNDREMKAKYDITQQHTLVVLDRNGNEVKRWIGGNFDLILNELKEI